MSLRDEILAKCSPALIASRDEATIAAVISVGRVKRTSKMITERGVRAALSSIPAGSQFMRLLKVASETTGTPVWFGAVLTSVGLPEAEHQDYADALASAYGWLRQDAGLDLGASATRSMLDLIAASDPAKYGATVSTLKALADQPDPVSVQDIAHALEGM